LYGIRNECGTSSWVGDEIEVSFEGVSLVPRGKTIYNLTGLRIGPSSNRKENLEVALLKLEEVELLETSIKIVSCL